nr:immunoglobulin light chain junction region [Macaca mulatta]MOY15034.1 immunoglobulin light chain junction region [Macaca mulatta]MOY15301.1 immunoglobulin light chain junction region [Macaca mulatta]MOY16426.1 immunoglobulin light chain junction region [Macaca mulatta]MOY16486.1 immunoglobulin light chain junction region [Macaca mulatta]
DYYCQSADDSYNDVF